MIHQLPAEFTFDRPEQFTDPFRYVPHPAVKEAARRVIELIESDTALASALSEGKMLGVLVCREGYLAAFSGNVGGRSQIEGFVPPIFDLLDHGGEFKRRESEITELNHQIERLLDSDRLLCLERELADALHGSTIELTAMKEVMAASRVRREEVRKNCTDPDILEGLIKESQHEKAEYRRLKKVLEAVISGIRDRIAEFHTRIESMKKQRAAMSESLQDWIFRQYIVHNALGESSSIADIFAAKGMVPPGGTGECAAPKLLEYAYRNGLKPLAMGEFWYGRSPETAVRTHGHFYPSCTSKCGPLLGYMLSGMNIAGSDTRLLTTGKISSSSTVNPVTDFDGKPIHVEKPVIIYEDESILVVEKPSGMPSVPGLDGRESLLEWLSTIMPGESTHIHAVHRLDMDTSGVMIFAKTHESAVNLRRQFEEHTVRKTYMARVSADATEPEHLQLPQSQGAFHRHMSQNANLGTIDLPLAPDYDERPRQKVDFNQGKEAHTEYEIVKTYPDGTADLLLYPHTGRTHQLRVHCAHTLGLGRPILGDLLYGSHSIYEPKNTNLKKTGKRQEDPAKPYVPERLHLHALSITFAHPSTDRQQTFTSRQFCY